MHNNHLKQQKRLGLLLWTGLLFFATLFTVVLSMGPTQAYQTTGTGQVGNSPVVGTATPTSVRDAFLYMVPQEGGPPNGGQVIVGQRFTLDLILDTGSNVPPNGASAQQSYMTFTNSVLQVITPTGTCPGSIPISTTVTSDTTIFDATLQNEVCNGPGLCTFRGINIGPGNLAFGSGALGNCPDGCSGVFRVASVTICPTAQGDGGFYWQFADVTPNRGCANGAPDIRDTEVVVITGDLVQDCTLFYPFAVHVVGAGTFTATPGRTFTPTQTRSPTLTRTRTATATRSATGTRTFTPTGTRTATSTRTPLGSVTPCAMNFSDVHETDYFYEAVRYLYCAGVVSGYSDGTFRPVNNTTRAQLCKIVVLAEGWPFDIDGGPHFLDVPTDDPFYFFIETAYNRRVIAGYSDYTFRPGNNVTRGQLCKIIVLAQGWEINTTGGPHFRDVPDGSVFYNYIETAYNRQIISGYTCGVSCLEFRPGNPATRAQISKIVFNALRNP